MMVEAPCLALETRLTPEVMRAGEGVDVAIHHQPYPYLPTATNKAMLSES